MLKIQDGLLGFLVGKLAPVSGYGRNMESVLRFPIADRNKKATSGRKVQREKKALCNDFTRAFSGSDFFNMTFPTFDESESGAKKAARVIMDHAISGSYPNSRISYPGVLISKGSLPGAEKAISADNEAHNILFSWRNNAGTGTAINNDRVILVAYFPAVKKVIYSVDSAIRKDCRALLETNTMAGYNAETWIGFISPDERNAANSRYTGTIYL